MKQNLNAAEKSVSFATIVALLTDVTLLKKKASDQFPLGDVHEGNHSICLHQNKYPAPTR